MTIEVLLADDSEAFREGFALLVRSLPGVELVGQASTGEEAVLAAARLQPQVVVMDLHMPGTNGVEATRRVLGTSPHIRVLVLSMLDDTATVLAAMRAGASGYLVKGAARDEIRRAIEAVAAGEAIFGPEIARQLLDRVTAPGDAMPFPELTTREREILDHLARGASNAAIGRALGIAPKTVRNHLSSVFLKLQVTDRARAAVLARDAGLGGGPLEP